MFRHKQSKEKVMYLKDFVNGSLKWRSSQHTVSVLTTSVSLANTDEYENYLNELTNNEENVLEGKGGKGDMKKLMT